MVDSSRSQQGRPCSWRTGLVADASAVSYRAEGTDYQAAGGVK